MWLILEIELKLESIDYVDIFKASSRLDDTKNFVLNVLILTTTVPYISVKYC